MQKHTLLAALLLSGTTLCALAQKPIKDTTATNIRLDDVVVSANKTEENHKFVAQQILKLDSADLSKANAQTTADLLANTAGIFVQKSQMGGGSPVLRGFEANRIVLMIDGVRMNNLIYRGGHLQNVITVDNAMLERAEVLFGPASTIYGSDALGGVIHFYTKTPKFATADQKRYTNVNAYTRYGSVNNEMTGHADFNIGGKKLSSLTSVTYSSFGDLMGGKAQNPFYDSNYGERPFYAGRINGRDTVLTNDNKYKQLSSGYTQYNIMQKLAYRQNDKTLHLLNLQFSSSTDIPRYDRLTDKTASGGLKSAEWYYGPQQRLMAAYSIDKKDNAAFFQSKRIGLNYQNIEESRHNRNFNNNGLAHRVENVDVTGFNLDYQRETGRHTIRTGLELQGNTLTSTAEKENIVTGARTPLDTRYPDGINNMYNTAVYGAHTWHINDRFTLTDGLRLGHISLHSTITDTSFFNLPFTDIKQNNFVYSGNAGLIHTPSDKLKISLLVSTGFRAPNIDDLAKIFESASGTLIVPNSNLKPEKTINTELGITKLFGNKVMWENALYYTMFRDAIVTAAYTYNGQDSVVYNGTKSRVLANQNQSSAYILGLSSNVRAEISRRFTLVAGATYTYGRINTDSVALPLDHIPPVQLRLQLSYSHKKFGADFFINYNGAKELKDYYLNGEDNEQYATPHGMPAWMTANLRVSWQAHKYITLQAGIDNLLDTQYRVFASGINAPGRNIFGVIRFHY